MHHASELQICRGTNPSRPSVLQLVHNGSSSHCLHPVTTQNQGARDPTPWLWRRGRATRQIMLVMFQHFSTLWVQASPNRSRVHNAEVFQKTDNQNNSKSQFPPAVPSSHFAVEGFERNSPPMKGSSFLCKPLAHTLHEQRSQKNLNKVLVMHMQARGDRGGNMEKM